MRKKLIRKIIHDLCNEHCIKTDSLEDCLNTLDELEIRCIPYSSLSGEKLELCKKCTDYGFTFRRRVYYNDNMPFEEIRFTLMHELGHIIMEHRNQLEKNEEEADYFASCILNMSA